MISDAHMLCAVRICAHQGACKAESIQLLFDQQNLAGVLDGQEPTALLDVRLPALHSCAERMLGSRSRITHGYTGPYWNSLAHLIIILDFIFAYKALWPYRWQLRQKLLITFRHF